MHINLASEFDHLSGVHSFYDSNPGINTPASAIFSNDNQSAWNWSYKSKPCFTVATCFMAFNIIKLAFSLSIVTSCMDPEQAQYSKDHGYHLAP